MAEDIIEIKNLNVTIAELRQESIHLSDIITSANLELKNAERELNEFLKKSDDIKKKEERDLSEIIKKKEEIDLNCSDLKKEIINHKESIKQLGEEKKVSQKELNKFNSWILTAKEEFKKLDLKNKEFDKVISKKEKDVNKVLKLENEIKGLEKKRDLLRLENDALNEAGKNEIVFQKTRIDKITEEIERLKKEAEYAQIKKKRIDNECTLKTQDLIKYTDRVKTVWEKVFPGKRMPMLK